MMTPAMMTDTDGPVCRIHEHSFRTGDCVLLRGPNGAGKTRMLLQLAGRVDAPANTLEVFGAPPGAPRHRARCSLLLDNAGLGAASLRAVYRWRAAMTGEDNRTAEDMLERLGLGPLAERSGLALSRGQERLAVLGLALFPVVRLALLDEPVMALDEERLEDMAGFIAERRADGLTILASSHDDLPAWKPSAVLDLAP